MQIYEFQNMLCNLILRDTEKPLPETPVYQYACFTCLKRQLVALETLTLPFQSMQAKAWINNTHFYTYENRTSHDLIHIIQKIHMHKMFSKSSLKIMEKVGFCMMHLNIYNKYYFSDLTLFSTREISYHFFKQNIITEHKGPSLQCWYFKTPEEIHQVMKIQIVKWKFLVIQEGWKW